MRTYFALCISPLIFMRLFLAIAAPIPPELDHTSNGRSPGLEMTTSPSHPSLADIQDHLPANPIAPQDVTDDSWIRDTIAIPTAYSPPDIDTTLAIPYAEDKDAVASVINIVNYMREIRLRSQQHSQLKYFVTRLKRFIKIPSEEPKKEEMSGDQWKSELRKIVQEHNERKWYIPAGGESHGLPLATPKDNTKPPKDRKVLGASGRGKPRPVASPPLSYSDPFPGLPSSPPRLQQNHPISRRPPASSGTLKHHLQMNHPIQFSGSGVPPMGTRSMNIPQHSQPSTLFTSMPVPDPTSQTSQGVEHVTGHYGDWSSIDHRLDLGTPTNVHVTDDPGFVGGRHVYMHPPPLGGPVGLPLGAADQWDPHGLNHLEDLYLKSFPSDPPLGTQPALHANPLDPPLHPIVQWDHEHPYMQPPPVNPPESENWHTQPTVPTPDSPSTERIKRYPHMPGGDTWHGDGFF